MSTTRLMVHIPCWDSMIGYMLHDTSFVVHVVLNHGLPKPQHSNSPNSPQIGTESHQSRLEVSQAFLNGRGGAPINLAQLFSTVVLYYAVLDCMRLHSIV